MKYYLVTGGATGIGRAVVEKLDSKDFNVINLDIISPMRLVENETNIKVDLSDYKNIKNWIPKNITYDGIFLNVGIHQSGSIFSQTLDEIENVINTNLLSNIAVLKALENNLKQNCSIVFNGSDQCFVGKYDSFAYGLTKGAIGQITKSLALDLAKYQIRVNTVCPGTTDTPLYRQAIEKYSKLEGIALPEIEAAEASEFPLGRIAIAEEVANVVLFLLSDQSSYITGSLIPIDGGYTAK